jgi:hypothetical protein
MRAYIYQARQLNDVDHQGPRIIFTTYGGFHMKFLFEYFSVCRYKSVNIPDYHHGAIGCDLISYFY